MLLSENVLYLGSSGETTTSPCLLLGARERRERVGDAWRRELGEEAREGEAERRALGGVGIDGAVKGTRERDCC